MTEKSKIDLLLSRQNILLLRRLIEARLLAKEESFVDDAIHAFPKEVGEELDNS